MTDTITLTGLVATPPRHLVTGEGLPITSFRLASTQRRFDRSQNRWVDGETNWYTITGFRQLAINITGSLQKGERVVVTGRLRIRDWAAGEKAGTTIEVDADAIGHDLSWGTSTFVRSISAAIIDPAASSEATTAEPSDEATAAEPSDEATAAPSEVSPEVLADSVAAESVAVPF
ncbi:single-stranded DNA-binding protein [Glaciihabitans sp. UYNi722]|uniref:single-stranded DNA-binding protein n=1 Tax=Glaciihabitans sp. UYNi722 TaxID=3156344 RepID=UPI003394D15D